MGENTKVKDIINCRDDTNESDLEEGQATRWRGDPQAICEVSVWERSAQHLLNIMMMMINVLTYIFFLLIIVSFSHIQYLGKM